jgi:hypothetical protein
LEFIPEPRVSIILRRRGHSPSVRLADRAETRVLTQLFDAPGLAAGVDGAELDELDSPLEAGFVSDFDSVFASVFDSALFSDFFSALSPDVAPSPPDDPPFDA